MHTAGVPLIQLSTDHVFPGDKRSAWRQFDLVRPLRVYGASKLDGELAVSTSGARANGADFVKTMLRVAATNPTLRVVNDQRGSPTVAADLAAVLVTIATRLAEDPAAPTGTFHFSNAGAVTWAGFAAEIFRQSALRGGPSATVTSIATADYPTLAHRLADSLLDCGAIRAAYDIVPRPWVTSSTN